MTAETQGASVSVDAGAFQRYAVGKVDGIAQRHSEPHVSGVGRERCIEHELHFCLSVGRGAADTMYSVEGGGIGRDIQSYGPYIGRVGTFAEIQRHPFQNSGISVGDSCHP